jgi:hypothetical protein
MPIKTRLRTQNILLGKPGAACHCCGGGGRVGSTRCRVCNGTGNGQH